MSRLLCVMLVFGAGSFAVGQENDGRGKDFDEAAVPWQDDRERMLHGLQMAETFRIELLTPADTGVARAAIIGDALEQFRQKYSRPLPERPTLARFRVTSAEFVNQLRGKTSLDSRVAFADFVGRWYGKWDQLTVDHHWHPVVAGSSMRQPQNTNAPRILGLQYAWIGDGFGWNYLVRPPKTSGDVVLGFVYHLKPREPRNIRFTFPLVGYVDGPGRLIWITPKNVYFEETDTASSEQRYAITGFSYSVEGPNLKSEGQGFQAVYTRHPDMRPEWKSFPVSLETRIH